ncbi:hypothetical protein MSG28_007685 [Choristoneura fumiferana]|uniref:Uncharacterized protein n=1 Tax=Choristoneura fumiferana TaxID=7141 RepID=A0ACC0JYD7_CHOFU|nr:hypothetical protein MSG28_007685 [Choristoneura fumiferana]
MAAVALPMESNPDTMNKYLQKLGVPDKWRMVDVIGLEGEALSWVPRPVLAIVLLFPLSDAYERHRAEQEIELQSKTPEVPKDVFHLKQVLSNVCGTIALVHSVANNTHQIELSDGLLKRYLNDAQGLDAAAKGVLLENTAAILDAYKDIIRSASHDVVDAEEPIKAGENEKTTKSSAPHAVAPASCAAAGGRGGKKKNYGELQTFKWNAREFTALTMSILGRTRHRYVGDVRSERTRPSISDDKVVQLRTWDLANYGRARWIPGSEAFLKPHLVVLKIEIERICHGSAGLWRVTVVWRGLMVMQALERLNAPSGVGPTRLPSGRHPAGHRRHTSVASPESAYRRIELGEVVMVVRVVRGGRRRKALVWGSVPMRHVRRRRENPLHRGMRQYRVQPTFPCPPLLVSLVRQDNLTKTVLNKAIKMLGRDGVDVPCSRQRRVRYGHTQIQRIDKSVTALFEVVAAGGIVLSVVLPGRLTRLLGTRLRLRTFALFGRRRAHHRLDVAAERQLLLLLHEGDTHGRRVRHGGLVVLLAERRRGHGVRRGVLRRRRREREQRVGVVVLRGGQGLVRGRRLLLEAPAPRAAAQRLGLQPGVQRRVERSKPPAQLCYAAGVRTHCLPTQNFRST